VTGRLSTHEGGGSTELDLELARRIERLATEQPDAGGVFTGAPGGWIG
jgi:pterin-4a-carbinolamine dehydratase